MEKSINDILAVREKLNNTYNEISGYDFYREIFPNIQSTNDYQKVKNNREKRIRMERYIPNPIYLYSKDHNLDYQDNLKRRIMIEDTFERDYNQYLKGNPFALCSGLSYMGRKNTLEGAFLMNALIIDLDGVGLDELQNLMYRIEAPPSAIRSIPKPTFIAHSGGGVHLYYLLKQPIELFPNVKLQLKAFKYALTSRIWDYKSTTTFETIQYQSISQAFRMVGSTNTKYNLPITAYEVGNAVDIDYLNEYVKLDDKVDILKRYSGAKISKEKAKELFPDWYDRVVLGNGEALRGKWNIGYRKRQDIKDYKLYEWWLKRVEEATGGHRYYFMLAVVIYASKNDVPKERLEKDLYEIFNRLKEVKHVNPLIEADVISALESYDKQYYLYPIDDIMKITNIQIVKNKRNGRNTATHLARARATQMVDYPNGEWRNKDGAPTKKDVIIEFREMYPEATKADCIRNTGISRNTVAKWWNFEEE